MWNEIIDSEMSSEDYTNLEREMCRIEFSGEIDEPDEEEDGKSPSNYIDSQDFSLSL